MAKITKILGILTVVSALIGMGVSFSGAASMPGGKLAILSMFLLQAVVGAFLAYGSDLKVKDNDLAVKMYPSSIAAYILFVVIAYRWFWYGV